MRVMTPAQAGQMPPNGIPQDYGGGGATASYDQTIQVSADSGPDVSTLFTPPTDGLYTFYSFANVVSATGAGVLTYDLSQPGGPGSITTFNMNLFTPGATSSSAVSPLVLLAADGPIVISRTVAGYAAPAGSYRLTVRAFLLA